MNSSLTKKGNQKMKNSKIGRAVLAAALAGCLAAPCAVTVPAYQSRDGTQPKQVSSYKYFAVPAIDGSAAFEDLPVAKEQGRLPKAVYLRDNTQSFSAKWEIALLDGTLYVRHRGKNEPWREAPMPKALKGHIKGISMDKDVCTCVDENDWIYTCENMFKEPKDWYWLKSYGNLLRTGDSFQLGNTQPGKWSAAILNAKEDKIFTGSDGRQHALTPASCSEVFYVDPQNPGNLVYVDPWLPRDSSHTAGSPCHARFRIESLSASGNTVLVTNKYGDLYLRDVDYDMSGGDPLQYRYSWDDQTGKKDAGSWIQNRLDDSTAAVHLPSPYWQKVPKVPGTITNRISIETTGTGSQARLLKVEGRKDGRTGYWEMPRGGSAWTFHPTDEPLKGTVLQNSAEDTSNRDLLPASGKTYFGTLPNTRVKLQLNDFAWNDSRQNAVLQVGSERIPVSFYNEYGNLGTVSTMEFSEHAEGAPRNYTACIELPADAKQKLQQSAEGQAFLKNYMGGSSRKVYSMIWTDRNITLADPNAVSEDALTNAFQLQRI